MEDFFKKWRESGGIFEKWRLGGGFFEKNKKNFFFLKKWRMSGKKSAKHKIWCLCSSDVTICCENKCKVQ